MTDTTIFETWFEEIFIVITLIFYSQQLLENEYNKYDEKFFSKVLF